MKFFDLFIIYLLILGTLFPFILGHFFEFDNLTQPRFASPVIRAINADWEVFSVSLNPFSYMPSVQSLVTDSLLYFGLLPVWFGVLLISILVFAIVMSIIRILRGVSE